jgi:hypothetical protein
VTFFGFATLASLALAIVLRGGIALLFIGMALSICITCISGIVFPYCFEIYPAAIRAIGAGLASTAGNAGGLGALRKSHFRRAAHYAAAGMCPDPQRMTPPVGSPSIPGRITNSVIVVVTALAIRSVSHPATGA